MTLLKLYDKEVKDFIETNGRTYCIVLKLTPEFLKEARQRIKIGAKKYADDWKYKNCLEEKHLEDLDNFNYTLLDKCQKKYHANRKPINIG